MPSLKTWLFKIIGQTNQTVSQSEKNISTLGGFVAIFCIVAVSQTFLELDASVGIIASMGASAVLLFAAPNTPLSQPWPLIGGHLFAAFIGVSCALLIDDTLMAASSAVGLTIAVMYYLNCIHPPGGATALTAVIGGESIHAMGYQFMLTPVLLNLLVILFIAIMFNSLFHWRRYPSFLNQSKTQNIQFPSAIDVISPDDFLNALKEIDRFVDINEQELRRIFQLASFNATQHLHSSDIKLGKAYSNGQLGGHWSIRIIIDETQDSDPEKDFVIFKQIVGRAPKNSDCLTRTEFAQWAKYEMIEQNGQWICKPTNTQQ